MTKRDKKIENMLSKLHEMQKRSKKAIEKADRLFEQELKAFKTK